MPSPASPAPAPGASCDGRLDNCLPGTSLRAKRAEAAKWIDALLERVVRADGCYHARLREVWVFGSFARGAPEVGDVDLAVEFDKTKDEAGRWFATLMAGGYDHLGALRRELRGNQRALHFNDYMPEFVDSLRTRTRRTTS